MSIVRFTDDAVALLRELAGDRDLATHGVFVTVLLDEDYKGSVRYFIDIVDRGVAASVWYDWHGLHLFVETTKAGYLHGTVIGAGVDSTGGKGFRFENPNTVKLDTPNFPSEVDPIRLTKAY